MSVSKPYRWHAVAERQLISGVKGIDIESPQKTQNLNARKVAQVNMVNPFWFNGTKKPRLPP